MSGHRIEKVNSSLKEVISDVIRKGVKNPHVAEMTSVIRVSTSRDLRHAKVYISIIGNEKEKTQTMDALKSAAGFIGVNASKQVRMRFFPELKFILDDSSEKHARIEKILTEINDDEPQEGSERTPSNQ